MVGGGGGSDSLENRIMGSRSYIVHVGILPPEVKAE